VDDKRLERIEEKLDFLIAVLNKFAPLLDRLSPSGRPMFLKKKVS
jgi:hypothetical protein